MNNNETAETDWIDYAQWVGRAARMMRSEPGRKIGLFDSSVPEPVELLATTVQAAYSNGTPDSYESIFLRNHPQICEQLAVRYQVPEGSVLCTTGATMAVDYVMRALCEPGDHVLIEHPGFDIFANAAISNGIGFSFFDRPAPDFTICINEILQKLRPQTRIVILTDLHNPSGVRADEQSLNTLATALAERGVCLMVDEVYADYATGDWKGLDIEKHPNLVRIGSLTKTFGLSSVRCGWMFVGESVYPAISSKLRKLDFGVSKLAHAMACEVFKRADAFDGWRNNLISASRPLARIRLSSMQEAGLLSFNNQLESCVCFPLVKGVSDTRALSKWLTEHHDVVVVPGECFGQPGHIRVGFAQPAEILDEGLSRLETGLTEYRRAMTNTQKIA